MTPRGDARSRRLLFLLLLSLGCSLGMPAGPAPGPTTAPAPAPATNAPTEPHSTTPPNDPTPTTTQLPAAATAAPSPAPSPTPFPPVETFFADEGRRLWLSSNRLRVAVDTVWGGAIREIWLDGDNVVNNYDGGRLIAVSFYDGFQPPASNHPNDTGWNPTPSDMYDHANPPLTYTHDNGTLYLKHRYIQWFPDDKGGGANLAVPSDLIVETWLRFFADPSILHARYRVTHEGADDHLTVSHEFPFVYPRFPYNRFVAYTGSAPWTNGAVTIDNSVPVFPNDGNVAATENWAGLVDTNDIGLVLWAPQHYAMTTYNTFDNPGPAENSASYLLPRAFMQLGPGAVREIQVFYIVGPWQEARAQIYGLNQALSFTDVLDPFGTLDAPQVNTTVSDMMDVAGWVIDDRQVTDVALYVDGQLIANILPADPRPDVVNAYPGSAGAPNHGFFYALDTTTLSNGPHTLTVWATDGAGNSSLVPPGPVSFTVAN